MCLVECMQRAQREHDVVRVHAHMHAHAQTGEQTLPTNTRLRIAQPAQGTHAPACRRCSGPPTHPCGNSTQTSLRSARWGDHRPPAPSSCFHCFCPEPGIRRRSAAGPGRPARLRPRTSPVVAVEGACIRAARTRVGGKGISVLHMRRSGGRGLRRGRAGEGGLGPPTRTRSARSACTNTPCLATAVCR